MSERVAREVLRDAAVRLRAVGIETATRDARRLMAHALGIETDWLAPALTEPLPEPAARRFAEAVARRARREPVSHIIGARDFYGRTFAVTGDVLDPRPETETLVQRALDHSFTQVLDLGTGSGCILLTLMAERPDSRGTGTDISAAALALAADNAARLGVADRVDLRRGDWFEGIVGRFDLIVSNPPYIAPDEMDTLAPEVRHWEPRIALTDEVDGLDAYRRIAAGAAAHLAADGRLLVEVGPGQADRVGALFLAGGLESIAVHPDLDGRARVVEAQLPPEGHRKRR